MSLDLKTAFRRLAARPFATTGLVVALTSSLTAFAAVFAVLDGLLLKAPPFKDSDALFLALRPEAGFKTQTARLAEDELRRLRAEPGVLAAFGYGDGPFEPRFAELEGLRAVRVTQEFFSGLGVRPLAGRWLNADDFQNAGSLPVVVGEALWRSRFGATPQLGHVEMLGGLRIKIVGVAGATFAYPSGANVWAPLIRKPTPFVFRFLTGVVRLQNRQLASDGLALGETRIRLIPLRRELQPDGIATARLLTAVSGVVLLIAWVHLWSLQTARVVARRGEMALQAALGATPGRLARAWWLEGGLVTLAIGALSFLLLPAALALLVRLLPAILTAGQVVQADYRTLAFLAVLTIVVAAALVGAPTLFLRRHAPASSLAGRLDPSSRTYSARRWHLLAVQASLVALLLYVSGVTVRSYFASRTADLGFEPENLMTVEIPGGSKALPALESAVIARVAAIPGVHSAATGAGPLSSGSLIVGVGSSPARSLAELESRRGNSYLRSVGPGYFEVAGIRLIEGRLFEMMVDQPGSIVLSESLARALASQSLVGKPIYIDSTLPSTVIGVVGDVRSAGPERAAEPLLYRLERAASSILVRAESKPTAVLVNIQSAVIAVTGDSGPVRVRLERDHAARILAPQRARALVISMMSTLAFVLGVIGVLSVSKEVSDRQIRDTAIKVAIGADAARLGSRLISRVVGTVLISAVAGTALGLFLARASSAFIVGVSWLDPIAAVTVVALLSISAGCAAIGPARRLMRADPARLLREH